MTLSLRYHDEPVVCAFSCRSVHFGTEILDHTGSLDRVDGVDIRNIRPDCVSQISVTISYIHYDYLCRSFFIVETRMA